MATGIVPQFVSATGHVPSRSPTPSKNGSMRGIAPGATAASVYQAAASYQMPNPAMMGVPSTEGSVVSSVGVASTGAVTSAAIGTATLGATYAPAGVAVAAQPARVFQSLEIAKIPEVIAQPRIYERPMQQAATTQVMAAPAATQYIGGAAGGVGGASPLWPRSAGSVSVEAPAYNVCPFGFAGVRGVVFEGVQLPCYEIHHLQQLQGYQLRQHAELLYRTIGAHRIASVPIHDHQLHAWIAEVHRLHLQPLLGIVQETRVQQPSVLKVREVPEVVQQERFVPKIQLEVQEEIVEVPHTLYREKLVEVPETRYDEVITEVMNVNYAEVTKSVAVPAIQVVETTVDVPQVLIQEALFEVPQVQCIELIREVPKHITNYRCKEVAVPVPYLQPKQVPTPVLTRKQELVEVPRQVDFEIAKEVPVYVTEQRDKEVVKIETEYREKIVEVPQVRTEERIIEVPETETREIIKQVPKFETQYIEKRVPKHVIEYIEKIVEVETKVYEERIVEYPEVEVREVIKHVPVNVVKYVDKEVPRHVNHYFERFEDVPTTLRHERPEEVTEIQTYEKITEVPIVQFQEVPKEVGKAFVQAREVEIQGEQLVLQRPRVVDIPEVQTIDLLKQVAVNETQIVEKRVPRVQVQPVEKVMEVPVNLKMQVPVAVPQQQVVEALVEELRPSVQEVQKTVSTGYGVAATATSLAWNGSTYKAI